ncbi:MAG: hypothetical protein EA404_02010 [Spirochaetaceae bacterium]|nr:MAG: hypothetical protein EA404_02010 [Spirochaetaceae bacterium]
MEQNADQLALFPLGLVLLPSAPLPLHIFEQRYRLMITQCIEHGTPFGVVYAGHESTQTIGCTARIERVIKRYENGTMDILCVGEHRFRTRATHSSSEPWISAAVDFFEDRDLDRRDELAQLARDAVKQLELYAAVVGGSIEREALLELSPQQLSFVTAASSMFSLEQRQQLLELQSAVKRLTIVRQTLAGAVARRRMARAAQRVIGKHENIDHLLN